MKRRMTAAGRIAAVAAAALVLLTACGSGGSDDSSASAGKGSSTLRFGGVGTTALSLDEIGWGIHRGIFEKHLKPVGIDEIKVTNAATGPPLNDALHADTLDVVSYGDTPAIVGRASGAKGKLIDFSSVNKQSLLITKPDGIKDIKDLDGKKIGTVIGSSMHRVVNNYLASEGIKVNWVSATDTALLKSGAIDGYASWHYSAEIQDLIRNQGYNLVFDSTDKPGNQYTVQSVASEDFLKSHPGLVEAWRAARAESVKDLRANESEFYDWFAKESGAPREAAPSILPVDSLSQGTPEEFDQGAELITKAKKILLDQKAITNDFDVDEFIAK